MSFPGAINVVNYVVLCNTYPDTPVILSYPQSRVTVRYSAVGSANGFTLSGASGNNLRFQNAKRRSDDRGGVQVCCDAHE